MNPLHLTKTTKNSYCTAQELNNIQLNKHSRMITLDIKIYMLICIYKISFISLNFG